MPHVQGNRTGIEAEGMIEIIRAGVGRGDGNEKSATYYAPKKGFC
jgi:hypothetical protein